MNPRDLPRPPETPPKPLQTISNHIFKKLKLLKNTLNKPPKPPETPRDPPRPLESIRNHVFEKKKFLKKNFIFIKISKYLECTPETSRDLPRPPETFREHLESCFLKIKIFEKKILISKRLTKTFKL